MPHVKKWWDGDVQWTLHLVTKKYRPYIEGYKLEQGVKKPIKAFVVAVDGEEIGYIQLYNAYDFRRDDGVLEGLPQSLAAFDFFIGNEAYVGKGYGTLLMRQFIKEYSDPYYDACCADPDLHNVQAIKAYEKVGFVKIKQIGQSILMLYTKPSVC